MARFREVIIAGAVESHFRSDRWPLFVADEKIRDGKKSGASVFFSRLITRTRQRIISLVLCPSFHRTDSHGSE